MRSMMLRDDHLQSLIEEIFSPVKYGRRVIDQAGTVDNPSIITRGEWVERKYKAWHEEDGSYHEQLIDDNMSMPTGKEGTD